MYDLNLVVVDLLGVREEGDSSTPRLTEGTDFAVESGSITIEGEPVTTTSTVPTQTTTTQTEAWDSDIMGFCLDNVTAAPGQQRVPVTLNVRGNTGITGFGIRVEFNTRKSEADAPAPLSPTMREDRDNVPLYDIVPNAFSIDVGGVNFDREDFDMIGISATSTEAFTEDGMLFTVYFDIPRDAQNGDVYPIEIEIVDLKGESSTDITDFTIVNGSITIEGEAVTTAPAQTADPTTQTTTTEPDIMQFYASDATAKPGQKGVPVSMGVRGNIGIKTIGARIMFNTQKSQSDAPPALSVQLDDDGKTPIFDKNYDAFDIIVGTTNFDRPDCDLIGVSATNTDLYTGNAALFTFYFDVPQDARAGDVYPIEIEMVDVIGESGVDYLAGTDYETIAGSITIVEDPPQTTLTTLTSTETTTTTTEPVETFGYCGAPGNEENLTWHFDPDTGELVISGSGDMADYSRYGAVSPWNAFKERLASLKITSGVTSVGALAFENCDNLAAVSVPDTVARIGDESFADCDGLPEVSLPYGVAAVGASAFADCESLASVTIENPKCEIPADSIYNAYENGAAVFYGTISGYENSAAQTYAEASGFVFESLGTAPGTVPSNPEGFGDVDENGVITIDDATLTLLCYTEDMLHVQIEFEDRIIIIMDVIDDDLITIDDATAILLYYTAESVTHEPMTWYEITGNPNAPDAPQ